MLEHPVTLPHLATLHAWGALSIPPVAKVPSLSISFSRFLYLALALSLAVSVSLALSRARALSLALSFSTHTVAKAHSPFAPTPERDRFPKTPEGAARELIRVFMRAAVFACRVFMRTARDCRVKMRTVWERAVRMTTIK